MHTIARAAGIVLLLVTLSANASQNAFTADQLLDRATLYVADFMTKVVRVVAEEQYVQEYLDSSVEGSRGNFQGAPRVRERRTLKSDFLLVKPAISEQWLSYRDVYEVDGRAVRDREDRLAKLFLESRDTLTTLERATEIAAASAQFNIRAVGTVDNPLLGLGFLQRSYRDKFRFTVRERDAAAGKDAWIVEFRETGRPTIIRSADNKDIAARGRYWIEAGNGAVVRSELRFGSLGSETSIATSFALDDRHLTYMPVEMRFRRESRNNEVRGIATYGRFRRFEVGTEEKLKK